MQPFFRIIAASCLIAAATPLRAVTHFNQPQGWNAEEFTRVIYTNGFFVAQRCLVNGGLPEKCGRKHRIDREKLRSYTRKIARGSSTFRKVFDFIATTSLYGATSAIPFALASRLVPPLRIYRSAEKAVFILMSAYGAKVSYQHLKQLRQRQLRMAQELSEFLNSNLIEGQAVEFKTSFKGDPIFSGGFAKDALTKMLKPPLANPFERLIGK